MPVASSIVPSTGQVDQAMQQRNRRKFFEEAKLAAMQKLTPNEVSDDFKYIKDQQKSWKDKIFGFNDYMEKDVPRSFKSEDINPSSFSDIVIERGSLGTDKLGAISTDKILQAITDSVVITGALAGSTTLNNGQQAVITITLDDTADANRIVLGVCHITPYHDSVAGTNIIPYGSATTEAQWHYLNRADWNSNNNKKSTWVDFIGNISAGASTPVLWRAHYRYIGKVAKDS
jgi:hypothetical protein